MLGVDVCLGVCVIGIDVEGLDIEIVVGLECLYSCCVVWVVGVVVLLLGCVLVDVIGCMLDCVGCVVVEFDLSLLGYVDI